VICAGAGEDVNSEAAQSGRVWWNGIERQRDVFYPDIFAENRGI
jgi:hypothetical protein